MNIQKRTLILLAVLLFLSQRAALAKTETRDMDGADAGFQRATVFETNLPEELRKVLDANGYAGFPCCSGAMLENHLKKAEPWNAVPPPR